MSGTIVNNVARASGTIAATPGGLDWSTAVVTGSTVTVEAGRGYFINTTSNACTVTLPASPEVGDQIVLADYARTWATNAVTLDSNGNNFQGENDTYVVDYDTVGQSLNIVYADSTKGWLPVSDDAVSFDHGTPSTQRGLYAFGNTGSRVNTKNLVNSSGVIASDAAGVGTARSALAATSYGLDKAIFGFGSDNSSYYGTTNLVNNSGVVGSDVSAVGTARHSLAATTYGSTGQAIFSFGDIPGGDDYNGITNLVNSSGVISADVTQVGSHRGYLAASGFGEDKGIFFGGITNDGPKTAISNLVSNSGVIASDTSAVGAATGFPSGARYGGDKAIFAFGQDGDGNNQNVRRLVNNLGVIASDASGAGTARYTGAMTSYGGDKAIMAFGYSNAYTNISNLINNSGVIASDVTGVGTSRGYLDAAGYSFSA